MLCIITHKNEIWFMGHSYDIVKQNASTATPQQAPKNINKILLCWYFESLCPPRRLKKAKILFILHSSSSPPPLPNCVHNTLQTII